jgi:hypothetical protein
VKGKGTKLGEGCPKVRLSQDRMKILSFHLAVYEGKGTKLGEGEGTKLGEGERDLEGERAIFGIIMFRIITIFWDSGFLRSGLFCSGKVRGAK